MTNFGDILLPEPKVPDTVYWRATVVGISPLSVQRDDGTILPEPPENFAGSSLSAGDRVLGATINTRAVIIGSTSITSTAPVEPNSGFSPQSGYEPVVRREGGRVYMDGGWSPTGMTTNGMFMVGTLPQWAWPSREYYFTAVSSSVAPTSGARCVVYPDGNVQIRTSGTLGSYYLHDGVSWPILD